MSADLRPWLKIEDGKLYMYDENGDKCIYAVEVARGALKIFAEEILRDIARNDIAEEGITHNATWTATINGGETG